MESHSASRRERRARGGVFKVVRGGWAFVVAVAPALFTAEARADPLPPLACPAGTTQKKLFYADEFWCARPDGTRHGPYRNVGDRSRTEGGYRDGKRHGWWRQWNDGVIVDERRLDRDREEGLVRTWSLTGVLSSRGMMSRGNQVGLWQWWHENGRRKEASHFERGERTGHHIEWSDDGALISDGHFRRDRREGAWIDSMDNGTQTGRGTYVRDVREGRWAFTFEGKRSAVGSYKRGWREGVWTVYGPDGNRVEARGRYHRGLKEGTWIVHPLDGPGRRWRRIRGPLRPP